MDSIVTTRSGRVRGKVAGGVNVFKGIPYAAPPFGANHLLPPKPAEPWTGVRDTLNFGPKPPQVSYPPQISALMPELAGPGEDCLTLNVWTSDLGSAQQPVMVWIPGGMFEFHATGASPWYDGSSFARTGIVCVTINYRVGSEGFLFLGEGNANRGLLDQIAALQWVRDNIATFGGDPNNVTVFGESAGALSIGALMSMPRAEGLFKRAILQSGAAHHASSAATGRRLAQFIAHKFDSAPTRESLARIPVSCILEAQTELRSEIESNPDPARWGAEVVLTMLPWQPVIDGEILPERPIDRIAAGASSDVDLLIGTNIDEHKLFLVPGGLINLITPEALKRAVEGYGLPVEATLAAYGRANPRATSGELLAAIQTDWYWRIPAIRLADAHAPRQSATYMYEFAWGSPQFGGRLGACHSLDIPFVFNTLGNSTELLWGSEPPQKLANDMHAAWITFASTGDAGWPRYDIDRRATMRFDQKSASVDDPRFAERTLWHGVR